MRVLLVEDDDDVSLLCTLALENAGHEVVTAKSGTLGVALAANGHADVIVLDGMLPDVDGLEVLRLLGGDAGSPAIPVVMASARVGRQDKLAALHGGATAYVVKPFEPDTIVRVVHDLAGLDVAGRLRVRQASIDAIGDGRHEAPIAAGADARRRTPATSESLGQVLNLAFDAIVSIDEDQRIVGFNRGAESIFGYLAEEVLGKALDVLLPESAVDLHRHLVGDFARTPESGRIMGEQRDVRGRRRDGSEFPVEASITKLVIDGAPVLTAILRDATERTRTEAELRNRALQQAAVAELGQRAATTTRIDDLLGDAASMLAEVLAADQAAVLTAEVDDQLLLAAGVGWSAGLVGHHRMGHDADGPDGPGTWTSDLDAPVVFEDLRGAGPLGELTLLHDHEVTSGMFVALRGRSRSLGTIGVFSRSPRSFTTDDIHVLLAFANVVASAIQRQKDEDRIRAFLDAAPDATLVVDRDGRVVSANAQAEVLFGYTRDELLRLGVDALVPDAARPHHASHRDRYAAERRSRPMGEGLELAARRKDGSEVAVDIMLRPLDTEEGPLVVAAVRDITERRRNEAVRDAFLHAVSHELRTPLTSVIGFSSLLVDQLGKDLSPEALDLAGRIRSSAGRLNRLLVDLLDLDRLARGVLEAQRRSVLVVEVLTHALEAVSVGEREVAVHVDPSDLRADLDPAQFERIVENLVVNATRHTPEGTRIDVRVVRSVNGLLLTVEDDGPGIPTELRESIFEPFRRNVDGGATPGTGIGLSLVARFAELHGGRAWVEEREGGGASFRVVLAG